MPRPDYLRPDCPHCGYPLKGLRGSSCPECGASLLGRSRRKVDHRCWIAAAVPCAVGAFIATFIVKGDLRGGLAGHLVLLAFEGVPYALAFGLTLVISRPRTSAAAFTLVTPAAVAMITVAALISNRVESETYDAQGGIAMMFVPLIYSVPWGIATWLVTWGILLQVNQRIGRR